MYALCLMIILRKYLLIFRFYIKIIGIGYIKIMTLGRAGQRIGASSQTTWGRVGGRSGAIW